MLFSCFSFFPSHLLSSPFYYLSLLVVTQIRGHIADSSPPLPTTVRALHFYPEEISALSSLVNSRRIVRTHARRSQQLILFFFFFCKWIQISPRRDSNSRINTSSIRGLPLVHRGDRPLDMMCLYYRLDRGTRRKHGGECGVEQEQEWARWARSTTSLQQLPTKHDHQYVSHPHNINSQLSNPPQYPVLYTKGTFLIIFPGSYHTPIIPREQMPGVYSFM